MAFKAYAWGKVKELLGMWVQGSSVRSCCVCSASPATGFEPHCSSRYHAPPCHSAECSACCRCRVQDTDGPREGYARDPEKRCS
jgi:hypothetical protein